jgi:hypothetical protein
MGVLGNTKLLLQGLDVGVLLLQLLSIHGPAGTKMQHAMV